MIYCMTFSYFCSKVVIKVIYFLEVTDEKAPYLHFKPLFASLLIQK